MYVYLVRHAIAFNPDPTTWPDDRDRPLTPQGEKRFAAAARGLRELAPTVEVVLSSPLVRAWQTAEILQRDAGWPAPIRLDELEPGRPPADVVAGLQPHVTAQSMALVGHEPSLHELASYLLASDPATVRMVMRKGGVACLQFQEAVAPGAAELDWLVRPRILRAIDS